MATSAYRATIFHCLADPGPTSDDAAVQYLDDGLLVVQNGCVEVLGNAEEVLPGMSKNIDIVDL